MPFVQMENISLFLRACQTSPLSLQPHDVFLTVDLYEKKDPAQVLQCLGAFSRRANAIKPAKFTRAIGPKDITPQGTGRNRGLSNASNASSGSGFKSFHGPKPKVSTWSRKEEEETTLPAWNIHQYGYMGGANQGNMGINFGGPRQITTAAPHVPSLEEKERRLRAAAVEEETRHRLRAEDNERRQVAQIEADEARAQEEEDRRWEEETQKLREEERRQAEEEKLHWAEEQQHWVEDERRRERDEQETNARIERERARVRGLRDDRLNGQFLSQYQATHPVRPRSRSREPDVSPEAQRIRELERELEQAKERERQYERERQARDGDASLRPIKSRSRSRSRPALVTTHKPSYDFPSQEEERLTLRAEHKALQEAQAATAAAAAAREEEDWSPPPPPARHQVPPNLPPRSLPPVPPKPARPLPDPIAYANAHHFPTSQDQNQNHNRTGRYLSHHAAPAPHPPAVHRPPELSTTAEVDDENARRMNGPAAQRTRAGAWASKSLLQREIEQERERQREWEEGQAATAAAVSRGVNTAGTGPGEGGWDVHQYRYLGGDNQNRGLTGIMGMGGRRQIVGPRPLP